jgi:hypothetical protein
VLQRLEYASVPFILESYARFRGAAHAVLNKIKRTSLQRLQDRFRAQPLRGAELYLAAGNRIDVRALYS